MGKHINSIQLTETLTLSECTDGFWLYDETRGMNLSMRAKTPQAALIECITYYQRRLTEVESNYKSLSDSVNTFINQINPDRAD